MNQFAGKRADGRSFLSLVLEPGNIRRLQQGQPIMLQVEALFPQGIPKALELAIHYSETPVADARYLAKVAEVTLDERPMHAQTRPHCPQCRSTIEELAVWRSEQSPVALPFCASCGCVFGCVDSAVFRR